MTPPPKQPGDESGIESPKDAGKPLGKERREVSQVGLLDAALKTVSQLSGTRDSTVRTLADRAMAEIKRAKQLIPARRKSDKHQPTE